LRSCFGCFPRSQDLEKEQWVGWDSNGNARTDLEQIRINHVIASKAKPVSFDGLKAKVEAALEAAVSGKAAAVELRGKAPSRESMAITHMVGQLNSLIGALKTLKLQVS
jgi:hypothetical protein